MNIRGDIICNDKLSIREIRADDTELILGWRNSQFVKKYFIYQKDITKEEHLNWIKRKVQTGQVVQYIIMYVGQPIGSVYLQDIDHLHNKAEYGIFIGQSDSCGKGIGTQVAKTVLQYAFGQLGLHRVYLRVLEENERAIHCYENAGFEKEAVLVDDAYINGYYRNVVIMAAINTNN